jgi:hypothetical protein
LSVAGTNRVVNIGSIFVTNPETNKNKTIPTIGNALPAFTSGTVTAPATGSGSITVSAGSPLTIAMTANQFLKIGININKVGNISLSAGTAGSSLAAATAPAAIANTFSPGYIVLRTDGSNNMANILNSDIYQYVGGGGGGSSGGSSTEIIQANTFSPGNLVYLNGSTYTLAKADSANTASVVGVVSVATSTQFTLNTSGLVTGLSGLVAGADYFLSPTVAGAITNVEPTTTGYVSQPIGIALSATELLVAIKRGVVIGTSNVFTSISLANTSATTIQNIASFANGEGGVLTGVIKVDATTDYVFGFEISFTKDIAGVVNHSVRYFAGDVLPGISVTVSGQNIQVTLGTLAGFVSATARFQLAASAVSPSLQVSSNNITYQEPTMFRNRIINGGMEIDQRNSGGSLAVVAAAPAVYCVDRWQAFCSGANVTVQRVAGSNGARFALRFTGLASNTGIELAQRIESFNCYDLANQNVTVSFRVSSTSITTLNWTVDSSNGGADAWSGATSVATGSLTINATDTLYSFTFNAGSTAINGLRLRLSAGALLASQTITFQKIQLERGIVATPFEVRPIGTELNLCYRYFYRTSSPVQSAGASASVPNWIMTFVEYFPVPMRTDTPTELGTTLTCELASPTGAYEDDGIPVGVAAWSRFSIRYEVISVTAAAYFRALSRDRQISAEL